MVTLNKRDKKGEICLVNIANKYGALKHSTPEMIAEIGILTNGYTEHHEFAVTADIFKEFLKNINSSNEEVKLELLSTKTTNSLKISVLFIASMDSLEARYPNNEVLFKFSMDEYMSIMEEFSVKYEFDGLSTTENTLTLVRKETKIIITDLYPNDLEKDKVYSCIYVSIDRNPKVQILTSEAFTQFMSKL